MSQPHATVAIISIGQMGVGIANLLIAHNFRVVSNVTDRSAATADRARQAHIELLSSDEELVQQADYLLSIVPPRDAVATAKRVATAFSKTKQTKFFNYLDLNAIAPATAHEIYDYFTTYTPTCVRFIDGGIIGGPPTPSTSESSGWKRPGIPISGYELRGPAATLLAQTLNIRYVGPTIGTASGLKCCFAALSKGFTALALQSFTTAAYLEVLEPLQDYLEEFSPGAKAKAENSIVGCTTKAYRWVEEMNQINMCFAEQGSWAGQADVFRQIAGVFQGLADTVEKRGTGGVGSSAEEVVKVLERDLKGKKDERELKEDRRGIQRG